MTSSKWRTVSITGHRSISLFKILSLCISCLRSSHSKIRLTIVIHSSSTIVITYTSLTRIWSSSSHAATSSTRNLSKVHRFYASTTGFKTLLLPPLTATLVDSWVIIWISHIASFIISTALIIALRCSLQSRITLLIRKFRCWVMAKVEECVWLVQ